LIKKLTGFKAPLKIVASDSRLGREAQPYVGMASIAGPRLSRAVDLERCEKKPWRKGSISRALTPYRKFVDTAPLREEKREVK